MLSIGEFLKNKREEGNFTVKEISTSLIDKGFRASEKTIYSWENNNSQPPIDAFLTMCQLYDVKDILYHLGYANNKEKEIYTSAEKSLIDNYRIAEDEIKKSVYNILDTLVEYSRARNIFKEKSVAPIINIDTLTKEIYRPLFDTPASAGTGVVLDEYISSEMTLLPDDAPSNVDFGIRISGDSMSPNIPDGSVVWAKKYSGESLIKRQIYIVEINEQAFCKMYDGKNFISINLKYSHLDIYETDTVRVSGRVLYIED